MTAVAPNQTIILITGCSSGIGNACCDLLRSGGTVIGASRTKMANDRWTYVAMDITDDASVNQAVDSILSRYGRIDAVVHCAGASLVGPIEETTVTEAMAQFQTNYFGTIRLLRAILPVMRRQMSGKIIIIGSIGGLIGLPFQSHYSATKFALDGMVEAMRNEVLPFNIFVSLLHPGNFNTALNHNRASARSIPADSGYREAYEKAARFYADEEFNARPPVVVARKVESILRQSRPRRLYLVGTPLELVGVFAKRILPSSVFDYFIRMFYFP